MDPRYPLALAVIARSPLTVNENRAVPLIKKNTDKCVCPAHDVAVTHK